MAGAVGLAVGVIAAPGLRERTAQPSARAAVSAPIATGAEPADDIAAGTVARVARAVLPSVVRINRASDDRYEGSGNGSGVIYRSDGFIITNNHVVADPAGLEVVFADGESRPATIVGQDPLNDLAVIRVDRAELTAMPLGRTRDVQVGDLAVAVGSPFGLDATVTVGVVSALGRGVHAGAGSGASVYLAEVVQTDAPINPGNSGGALVDAAGRLIGINSAILTSGQAANAGVGFAIPVDTVADIADELIDSGAVAHPLLGVRGTPVGDAIGGRLGVDAGAWISAVTPGTPAADAGLRPDDVVVKVDDVAVASMEDLIIAVRRHAVGDRVVVRYVREGRRRSTDVVLAEREETGAQ